MQHFPSAVFAVAVLTACQSPTNELTQEQKAAIASEVNALHTASVDAWTRGAHHRGMFDYLQTPEFTYALEGQLVHGFAALHDASASWLTSLASRTSTRTESHTTVLGPNVVCIMEQGAGADIDAAGVTGPELPFARTAIYVRHDGEWKLQFAHVSVASQRDETISVGRPVGAPGGFR